MKIGFFEEKENSKSMMRLLSYQLEWFLFIFDLFYIWINTGTTGFQIDKLFIAFNIVMLLFIFVPKLLQKKFGEIDINKLTEKLS